MIDLNFVEYALDQKNRRMKYCLADELPRLAAEANELLRILEDGNDTEKQQMPGVREAKKHGAAQGKAGAVWEADSEGGVASRGPIDPRSIAA